MSVFIVAEIGINHNGDINLAKKLIDMAVVGGCDAVKFQKRTIDVVYTKDYLEQPRKSPWGETQRAQKNGLEFGKEEYDIIDFYCKEKGIKCCHINIPYPKQRSKLHFRSAYAIMPVGKEK